MSLLDAVLDGDRHLIHPLHDSREQADPIVFHSGKGNTLIDVEGREYLDAFSGLWNVLVGYGRMEIVERAAEMMGRLPYASSYSGYTNVAAAELGARLAGYAYPGLNATFFTSGGAESNESAFKTARYYWKRKGRPEKTRFIARYHAYHGVTLAAMSATGIPPYWTLFEPRVPGFAHVPAPYPYRFQGARPGESVGQAAARMVEEAILAEGPENVAAVIAEPVQGAGGVIVPPDDYFPAVREICDRHEALLIADEVITGFGRTGKGFALHHWGVAPDILTFAKGITSGYVPLGGMQVSDEIRDVLFSAPPSEKWMHAFTYSGHPVACAAALANLDILEGEGLTERAAAMGVVFNRKLRTLLDLPWVGEVRGLGMMAAVELVADRATRTPAGIGDRVRELCRYDGVLFRVRGDVVTLAPSLITTEAEMDRLIAALCTAIVTAAEERSL